MRTRARQRGRWVGAPSGAPVLGLITAITVVGGLNDTATATLAPAVTNGQSIPLDTAGWVLLIQCSSAQTIADATKLTVNIVRPGYTNVVGAAAITRTDTAIGVKVLRRAFPNQASALNAGTNAFYVVIDNMMHVGDTIASITLAAGFFTGQVDVIPIGAGLFTNSSGLAYAKPIIRPVTAPYRRNPAAIEYGAVHEWAAFGQQVARIEHRWKSGASYGPWTGSGTMVRSAETPSSGRLPSTFPAPVYSCTTDFAGCPNSTARDTVVMVYRAYGWYGDVIFDSETDGDALGTAGIYQSLSPPTGLPIIRDSVGNHTPIYAWVNRDGTAGGSAAIQTTTTDPGAAASYASENAAMVAARAWNNNSSNRTNVHNTTSGIVMLYRDVAGGVLGNSDLAYWGRATMIGFSDGLLPPVLASASYLSTGTTSLDCRKRGVQDNGTTAATSKLYSGAFEFRGMTFDGIGLTGANHTVLDGATNATSAAVATTHTIMVDCDIRENSAAGSGNLGVARPGWWFQYRCDVGGLGAGEGPPGAAALGQTSTLFAGLFCSIGSLYSRGAIGITIVPASLLGCWLRNVATAAQAPGIQPSIEFGLMVNVRIDAASPAAAVFTLFSSRPVTKGFGICNVMVRVTGTYGGPMMRFSGDGARNALGNIVVQHLGGDGGFDDNSDRLNCGYNDQGYIQIVKRVSMRYAALGSYNIKDDVFGATEGVGVSGTTWEGAWAAAANYSRGDLVHDGNATAGSRFWFQAVANHTSGAVQATDLADAGKWLALGQINGNTFGAQPLRTGNWRTQHGVRNYGNVATRTANADTVASPGSWYGEAWGRGGSINATWANYFKTRTGGTLSTLTTYGDYRPQSIAAGDAVNSPLLGRVAVNEAVVPFDLAGTARLNNGTGAAGPYERSA